MGPVCSHFCRQSWLNPSANFIRGLPVPGRGLISPLCPVPTHPPTFRPEGVCLCLIFTFLHLLAQMWTCRRCPMLAKISSFVPFGVFFLTPPPFLSTVLKGGSLQFWLLLEVQHLCLCDLEYKSVPLPRRLFPVPFSMFWVPGNAYKKIQYARQLQRWKCSTWWVYLGGDGAVGRADKMKVWVAWKFSGELKILQMGAASHINSVCFLFVSVCLQITSPHPVSSSFSCPL